MFGWRGRIGHICPGVCLFSSEFDRVLPEGVICAVMSLGVYSQVLEEFKRVSDMYLEAAEQLASREVGFIAMGGLPLLAYKGYDGAKEMAKHIQDTVGIPTILSEVTVCDALDKLGAKKIVEAVPWHKDTQEVQKAFMDKAGFEVLNIKGLGLKNNVEIGKQPPYASYRLAKEAFYEAPEADAIYIGSPAWQVVGNIQTLEADLGKPVVSAVTAMVWAALTTMHIKGPIRGYGRLLEML